MVTPLKASLPPNPDSGYFTPTGFDFDEDDLPETSRSMTPTVQEPPDTPELPWDLNQGFLFQRRKRSFSNPSTFDEIARPSFLRSQSCSAKCRVRVSVATQTDDFRPASSLAAQISQHNPLLPGALLRRSPPVGAVQPWFRDQSPPPDLNNNPDTIVTIAHQLRDFGDTFNNEHRHLAFFNAFDFVPLRWLQDWFR